MYRLTLIGLAAGSAQCLFDADLHFGDVEVVGDAERIEVKDAQVAVGSVCSPPALQETELNWTMLLVAEGDGDQVAVGLAFRCRATPVPVPAAASPYAVGTYGGNLTTRADGRMTEASS